DEGRERWRYPLHRGRTREANLDAQDRRRRGEHSKRACELWHLAEARRLTSFNPSVSDRGWNEASRGKSHESLHKRAVSTPSRLGARKRPSRSKTRSLGLRAPSRLGARKRPSRSKTRSLGLRAPSRLGARKRPSRSKTRSLKLRAPSRLGA